MAGERVEGAQAVLLDYLDGRNVGCNECHCEECRAKYPHDCRVMRAVAPASAPPQPAAGACLKCRSIRTADGACRCPRSRRRRRQRGRRARSAMERG